MFCPECGFENLVETSAPLTEDFKGEQITVHDVTRYECPRCHEYVISADQSKKMTKQLYSQYRNRFGLLSPSEIKDIRKKYGWNQTEFERVLGVTSPTVSRWESGRIIQTKPVDNLMRTIGDNRSVANCLASRAEVSIKRPGYVYASRDTKKNNLQNNDQEKQTWQPSINQQSRNWQTALSRA